MGQLGSAAAEEKQSGNKIDLALPEPKKDKGEKILRVMDWKASPAKMDFSTGLKLTYSLKNFGAKGIKLIDGVIVFKDLLYETIGRFTLSDPFPWTQNWLNRSVQGGPEHDR